MSSMTLPRQIRAAVGVTLAAIIAAPWLLAPPALAGTATATITTIDVADTVVPPTFDATVTVSPNPVVQGQIGTCVTVDFDGVGGICAPLGATGAVTMSYVDKPLGVHTIHAVFAGGGGFLGSSATLQVTVGRQSSVDLQATKWTATSSELVTVSARVVIGSGDISGGSLSIEDATTGTLIAVVQVGPTRDRVSVTRRFSAGDRPLTASYSGNPDLAGSSASATLSITADTKLEWMGMAKLPAAFYPVVDGYRDTLRVATVIDEPASVVVRIKNANGHLVRSRNLGPRAAGTVAWAWDGRNGSGTLLPSGTYTVTVRVTDMSGNTATGSATTSLSHKKLAWHTQTITKHGDGYTYAWDPADGSISQARSAYPDGVRLTAGEAFVGVRYGFVLHAATVYGSLSFRVLGRSPAGYTSVAGLWRGAMDKPVVTADRAAPYDRSKIGPGYRWWTVTKSSVHRNGRQVYAQVLVEDPFPIVGGGLNTFDIAKVQLVYRYAVLQ